MTLGERVKNLRKRYLRMTAEAFGNTLGVNRDVIYNIEQGRLANPEQKEPLYRLICKEFGISYEWLMTGEGEMLAEADNQSMDGLASKYDLCGIEKDILSIYLELPKQTRELFMSRISGAVLDNVPQHDPQSLIIPDGMTEEEAHDAVDEYFERQKKAPEAGGGGKLEAENEKLRAEIEKLKKEIEAEQRAIEAEHARLARQYEDVG